MLALIILCFDYIKLHTAMTNYKMKWKAKGHIFTSSKYNNSKF